MSERRNLRGRIDQELGAEPPADRAAGLERWVSPTTESAVDQVPLENIDEPEWRVPIDTADQAYRALKSSVRASGILQPLLLRPHGDGRFQLVAGARRLQAARETMQATVPAIIRTLGDLEALVGSWDAVLRAGATPAERESLRARLVGTGMPEADAAALLSTVPVREGAGATITTPEVAIPAPPPSRPAAEPVVADEAVSDPEPVAEDDAVEGDESTGEAEAVAEVGAVEGEEDPAELDLVTAEGAVDAEEPAAEPEPDAEEATETLVGVPSPVGPEEVVEPLDEEEWSEAADDAATEGALESDAPAPAPVDEAAAEPPDDHVEVPEHGPRHAAAEVHEAEEAVETLVEVPPVVGPEEPVEPEEEQEWREAAVDAAAESAQEMAAADSGAQREEPVVMAPLDAPALGSAPAEAAAPHVIPIRLPAAELALDDEPVVTAPGGGRSPVLAALPEDPVPASSTDPSSAGARRPSSALADPQNYAVLGAALFIGSVVFIIISVLLGAGGGSQLAVAIVVALVGIVTAIVSFALPQVRP